MPSILYRLFFYYTYIVYTHVPIKPMSRLGVLVVDRPVRVRKGVGLIFVRVKSDQRLKICHLALVDSLVGVHHLRSARARLVGLESAWHFGGLAYYSSASV